MRLSKVLLAALLALGHPHSAGGRVVAVWTDIEAIMGGRGTPNATTPPAAADVARSERFIEVITNASTLAHTGGFRLAVDANAAWSGRVSTDLPLRPLHQAGARALCTAVTQQTGKVDVLRCVRVALRVRVLSLRPGTVCRAEQERECLHARAQSRLGIRHFRRSPSRDRARRKGQM